MNNNNMEIFRVETLKPRYSEKVELNFVDRQFHSPTLLLLLKRLVLACV
jgi:hypothetical protein